MLHGLANPKFIRSILYYTCKNYNHNRRFCVRIFLLNLNNIVKKETKKPFIIIPYDIRIVITCTLFLYLCIFLCSNDWTTHLVSKKKWSCITRKLISFWGSGHWDYDNKRTVQRDVRLCIVFSWLIVWSCEGSDDVEIS
jgi:hypothetical protein